MKRPMAVLFTDSNYLLGDHHLAARLEEPRRTADKKPVKNQDLWQRLEQRSATK